MYVREMVSPHQETSDVHSMFGQEGEVRRSVVTDMEGYDSLSTYIIWESRK